MLLSMTKPIVREVNPDADERILCDVMRQITWQADIDARDLRLSVENGVVQLFGSVETCMEKAEAENAAKAVYGVSTVINDLEIVARRFHDDAEIAREIDSALCACSTVLEQPIRVSVNGGVAVLRGSCRWEFQKSCAERIALAAIGVKSVVNLIAIEPSIISKMACTRPTQLDPILQAS